MILAMISFLTGSLSFSRQPTTIGVLSAVDCIRGFSLALSAIKTRRVASKTATALVITVLTSAILAISFLSAGGVTYVPLTMEIFGSEKNYLTG